MTVFLTPDGEPFYAGTYFPPEPRHGMPSLPAAAAWRSPTPGATQRDEVGVQAAAARRGASASRPRLEPSAEPLDRVAPRRGGAGDRARVRAGVRRLRAGAEVPAGVDARVPAAGATRPQALEMVTHDARRDGARAACTTSSAAASTATRSTTAGSCRTSRRCSTTTRCSRSTYLHAWVVTGEARYRDGRRGDARLRPARARAPGRRARIRTGRRHDGVEGLTYTWTPEERGRARRAARAVRARALDRPGRARRRSCAAGCSTCASGGSSRFATTRRSPPGTASRSLRSPRPATGSSAPDWLDGGARCGRVPARAALAPDGGLLRARGVTGAGQRRGIPRRLRERRPRPARAARRDRGDALAARGAPPRAARRRALRRRRARWLLPLAGRRRRPRRAHEGPRRQPDPVGQLDARPRTAPAGPDLGRRRARTPRGRCSASWQPALPRAPTAFGWALCALDLYLSIPRELAIVGPVDSAVARAALTPFRPEHDRCGRPVRIGAVACREGARRREAGRVRLRALRCKAPVTEAAPGPGVAWL